MVSIKVYFPVTDGQHVWSCLKTDVISPVFGRRRSARGQGSRLAATQGDTHSRSVAHALQGPTDCHAERRGVGSAHRRDACARQTPSYPIRLIVRRTLEPDGTSCQPTQKSAIQLEMEIRISVY